MANILTVLYISLVGVLSLYGVLGFITLVLFWRHKNDRLPEPTMDHARFPRVTVQLPIYNERLVVERLIDAAVRLNYPTDKLQIQVIDDSDDDTVNVARTRVAFHRANGVDIHHVRRRQREGYKAGALAVALERAGGEYIAIFDADFQPEPDFLLDTTPYFINNPRMGMIQTRWGHLNASDSSLTAAQSIALDKHFVMEQTVRHRANMFPKFNGSAGIWRRSCIEDAGGWQSDTVCEDLCLSTRATLKGWEFLYLDDVVAPAELPASIRAYKNQQARWAKGSVQCLQKYGGEILRDSHHTIAGRLYAIFSMSAYFTHLLLLFLLVLQLPMLLLNIALSPIMFLFTVIGLGQPLLFVAAQKETYPDWGRRLLHFPVLLLVAVGIAPSNAHAIVEAMFGKKHHTFIRTPKGFSLKNGTDHGQTAYILPLTGIVWLELALAVYAGLGIGVALMYGQPGPLFLLLTSFLGFSYVLYHEIREAGGFRLYLHP